MIKKYQGKIMAIYIIRSICKALLAGYRAADLLEELFYKKTSDRFKMFKSLSKINVLVLDDFGIEAIPEESVSALFNFIDDRYKHNSTIIATQIRERGLIKMLGGAAMAEAIVDRLMNPCIKIELKGGSRRKSVGGFNS